MTFKKWFAGFKAFMTSKHVTRSGVIHGGFLFVGSWIGQFVSCLTN